MRDNEERGFYKLIKAPKNGAKIREKAAEMRLFLMEIAEVQRMKEADAKTAVEIADRLPEKARTIRKKTAKKTSKRAKARNGSEKLTPAALYRKMIAFGKSYQVEKEQDFIEAARIYAEEAGLIDQMRDKIAEDGLTVEKTYKTGSVEVAHPLLSELPRHVESANKCLATIGNMIGERGARVEKAARDLDAFRLH